MNKNISEKPVVYVGIRTYNSEDYINKCLSSVLKQTYPNMSVVIFDDASTDETMRNIKLWKYKFERNNIPFSVKSATKNKGCGASFEQLARNVAGQMQNNDIFVMIDSDDEFRRNSAIEEVVRKLESDNANICISGFRLTGNTDLALNQQGGLPHNKMAEKLARSGGVTVVEMPEIASNVDSIGWTKIVRGNIFKKYMDLYPKDVDENMKVCEDFPSLNMLLFKDAKITGVEDPIYDYFKHAQSSTTQVRPEDFSVVRIGWLKATQSMSKNNPELFVDDAEKYVNNFLKTKYEVISNIVHMKKDQLKNFTVADFQSVFKKEIDCSELGIDTVNTNQFLLNKKRKQM